MGLSNNTKMTFLAAVVVCCMVVAAPAAEAAVSCSLVTSKLVPCIAYLRSGAGPSSSCCAGVKGLAATAATTADRRTACSCLKQTAGAISGFNYKYASDLPGKCGVSVPYPISPSTDCSKIS